MTIYSDHDVVVGQTIKTKETEFCISRCGMKELYEKNNTGGDGRWGPINLIHGSENGFFQENNWNKQ